MGLYRLTPVAEQDIVNIYVYGVKNFGEAQADSYLLAFYDTFKELAENPYLYPADEHHKPYRRAVCGRDTIYYRIIEEGVEITTILGRQDHGSWL